MDSLKFTGRRKPRGTYLCKRCKTPGHWLTQCPTNLDPSFDTVPPRYHCPLCGVIGKHLVTICPENTQPSSLNQQRILAGVTHDDRRRDSRQERQRFRLSSAKSFKQDALSRCRDRSQGQTRGRSRSRSPRDRAQNDTTGSRMRERSALSHSSCRSSPQRLRYSDDDKDDGLAEWEADYGLMNADRARIIKSDASGPSRDCKKYSTARPDETDPRSNGTVRTPTVEEARRRSTTPSPRTRPRNDRQDSPGASDQQPSILRVNMALRARQPQDTDQSVNTDSILRSVEEYIAEQLCRESRQSKSPERHGVSMIEPVMGTNHPLDCYSAAAYSLILRCGLGNPWVNYVKRRRALELWDKKEQALGTLRARKIRPRRS